MNTTIISIPFLSGGFAVFVFFVLAYGALIAGVISVIYAIVTSKQRRQEEEHRIIEERERIKRAIEKAQEEERKRIHEDRMRNDYFYRKDYEAKLNQERIEREERERKAQEAKRKAEEKRKGELKAAFHYITVGRYNAAYRYDYYPKNRYPFIASAHETNRNAIWRFKDGMYALGVDVLSDFLEGNYTSEQIKNLTLCVIPASSLSKNERRYKTMCGQVASKYSLCNGYSLIQIVYDRSDSREHKSSNTIDNLSFSPAVRGRDVILFDDITTRGTSFIQVANELVNHGAHSVFGVFLGKTIQ